MIVYVISLIMVTAIVLIAAAHLVYWASTEWEGPRVLGVIVGVFFVVHIFLGLILSTLRIVYNIPQLPWE